MVTETTDERFSKARHSFFQQNFYNFRDHKLPNDGVICITI